MSELIWAAKNGDLDQVKELIEKDNLDVNSLVDGRLLLVEAADYNQFDVIKYLVEKGADVNAADPRGITPLLAAIYEGHTRCVSFLLLKGASPKGEALDGKSYLETAEKEEIRDLLSDYLLLLSYEESSKTNKEELVQLMKEEAERKAFSAELDQYADIVLFNTEMAFSGPDTPGRGQFLKKVLVWPDEPVWPPNLLARLEKLEKQQTDIP